MIADAMRAFALKFNALTQRERASVAVLAAIAAFTCLVYSVDWANSRASAAALATEAAAASEELQAAFADEAYLRRLASESLNVRRWSRGAGALDTEEVGLELEQLALLAGLNDARVVMVQPPERRAGHHEATISAQFDWTNFLALLEALESSEISFSVRSIDVSEGNEGRQVVLVIVAPIIEDEDAP